MKVEIVEARDGYTLVALYGSEGKKELLTITLEERLPFKTGENFLPLYNERQDPYVLSITNSEETIFSLTLPAPNEAA
jgi:hypothetical protein